MGYTLDQNGMVTWTDEPADAGPGGNQTAYDVPSVQDRLQMSLPVQNNSPVPQDILDSVMGNPSATPTPTPTQTPTSTKVGEGFSVGSSHSGIDLSPGGAFDLIQTKGMRGFNKDIADGHNKAVEYGKRLDAGYSANIDEQKQAAAGIADVEAQRAEANAGFTSDIARMEQQNAVDNAADYANIQNKVAGKMADYEAAINDLASSSVNPGRAYSSLTNAAKGGVLATAFITDFLGAKGIKTHGMDYIDQMIQRDIDSQRTDIEIKGQVAAGKLNIYKMFKEQGDSDYMAAEKTRGALFNAAKTEIIGKLAAYDSPMVKARLGEAMAKFGEKEIAHKAAIAKEVQDQENIYYQNALTKRQQDLSNARASEANKLARDRFTAEQNAARDSGAALEAIKKRVVRDVDGKVVGTVAAGNDTRVAEIQDRLQVSQGLQRQLDSLAKKITTVYNGPGASWTKDRDMAMYESEWHNLLYKVAKANDPGGRLSDTDIKEAVRAVPLKTLTYGVLNGGGMDAVDATLNNLGYGTFKDLQETVNSNVMPITDQATLDALQGGASPGSLGKSGAYANKNEIVLRGDNKASNDVVDAMIGKLDNSTLKSSDATTSVDPDILKFITQNAQPGEESRLGPWSAAGSAKKGEEVTVPRWLVTMNDLHDSVFNADLSKEQRDKAEAALHKFATSSDNPELQAAAYYFLNDIYSKDQNDTWK